MSINMCCNAKNRAVKKIETAVPFREECPSSSRLEFGV